MNLTLLKSRYIQTCIYPVAKETVVQNPEKGQEDLQISICKQKRKVNATKMYLMYFAKDGNQEAMPVTQQSAQLQEKSLFRQLHRQRKKGYAVVQCLCSSVPKSL